MTAVLSGFYTDSDYWGFIGYDPHGYVARHNPGVFMTKGTRLYRRFATESEYLDWWKENFTEYYKKEGKIMDEYTRLKQRVSGLEEVTSNLMATMQDLIKAIEEIKNRSIDDGK